MLSQRRHFASVGSSKYRYIDALRGIAIFGVIAAHAAQAFIQHGPRMPDGLRALTRSGARGVQLFYIVSAMTLFMSLQRRVEERCRLRNYFIRRFFRIAPMFYCAMAFFLIHDGLGPRYFLGDAPGVSLANILATATFTNGWNPYWITSIVPGGWSVAVETGFYLLLPLLFAAIVSLPRAILFTVLSLALAMWLSSLLIRRCPIGSATLWKDFLYFWLPNQLPIFALGIVAFHIHRIWQDRGGLPARRFWHAAAWPAHLLLACALACLLLLPFQTWLPLPGHFLHGLTFGMLVISLALYANPLLVNSFWTWMGKVSFSAYLSHFVIIGYLAPLRRPIRRVFRSYGMELSVSENFLVFLVVCIVVTMAVSTITYLLLERPGLALGQRLVRRLEKSGEKKPDELAAAATAGL